MSAFWLPLRCLACNGEFLSLRDHEQSIGFILHAHCPICRLYHDCIVRDPSIPYVGVCPEPRNAEYDVRWLTHAYDAPSCSWRNS